MHKNIFVIFLVIIICGNPANVYANSDKQPIFFQTLQDIPLMNGLEELADQSISFDKPSGRIVELFALMHDVTKLQVLEFYQMTLPQFGWGIVSENQYFRQNELLLIEFYENNNHHLVKIMIKPTL